VPAHWAVVDSRPPPSSGWERGPRAVVGAAWLRDPHGRTSPLSMGSSRESL
jgi:hypothetical protein